MTETSPMTGQIEAPNPIELFWERNRRTVVLCAVVIAAVFGANYARQYFAAQRTNRVWSDLSVGTRLDQGYSADGQLSGFLTQENQRSQWLMYYIQATRAELVTELPEDVGSLDATTLAKTLEDVRGNAELEPLVLWVAAHRSLRAKEWDSALASLQDLESRYPTHFLATTSVYPVQDRRPVEAPKPVESSTPKAPKDKPKLIDPKAGSAVSLLRERIQRQRDFTTSNPSLYQAPEPDPAPEAVIKLSNGQEIRIRFYAKQAPKHVESFLKLAREGFYQGQRIDQVQRRSSQASPTEPAQEQMHFGLPASKEDDRTKWDEARNQPGKATLDFEFTDVSHFPGTVSADTERDGKSSGERIWINASDCSQWFDGERVAFGRVVQGMEAVEEICRNQPFEQEQESRDGRGKLQQMIAIESITIVESPPK